MSEELKITETPESKDSGVSKKKSKKVKLTQKHKDVVDWLQNRGYGEYDPKESRLITHTFAIRECWEDLGLKGFFDTIATGKKLPGDRNVHLYPKPGGAWLCIRYKSGGQPVKEVATWKISKKKDVYCFLNRAEKKPDVLGVIIKIVMEHASFFHTPDKEPFAIIEEHGHKEVVLVDGDDFRQFVRLLITDCMDGCVAQSEWLYNIIDQLKAHACRRCPCQSADVRVTKKDGKYYLDLADENRTVYEIDGDDWRPAKNPPPFWRPVTLRPLPIPEKGGTLDDFWTFCNVDVSQRPLVACFITSCFAPDLPAPCCQFYGGDGKAKTNSAYYIMQVTDPTSAEGCAPPDDSEALVLSAMQRRLCFFDNHGEIKRWLADCYCRLITGGSIQRRKKYKNSEVSTFTARRPLLITSIKDIIAEHADLNSRTLKFELVIVKQ